MSEQIRHKKKDRIFFLPIKQFGHVLPSIQKRSSIQSGKCCVQFSVQFLSRCDYADAEINCNVQIQITTLIFLFLDNLSMFFYGHFSRENKEFHFALSIPCSTLTKLTIKLAIFYFPQSKQTRTEGSLTNIKKHATLINLYKTR